MTSTNDVFATTEKKLNTVSSTMCLAKWTQVTLHLGTGTTHSCHHPTAHKIPLVELQRSPQAIHNTDFKKQQRKLMLEGKRPLECDYCWRVEDARQDEGNRVFSDRFTKSAEEWSMPHFQDIVDAPWDADIYPTYVEVDFETTCNFKCLYCSPSYSTTWMAEINRHGPVELSGGDKHHNIAWLKEQGVMPIPQNVDNPYVNAFWEWWPEAVKHMKVFRITGGEPLLSKHTFSVLDYLLEHPQPQLEFNVNSNLGVPEELIERFVARMKAIQAVGAVKSFKLYTSCEAAGAQAEYIRFGLDYAQWLTNCRNVLTNVPQSNLTVMAAVNVLSFPSFKQFVIDMLTLRTEFADASIWPHRVGLDLPYVRWPFFLAPWILPDEQLLSLEETTKLFSTSHNKPFPVGFSDYEINKFQRLFYVVRDEAETLRGTEKLAFLRIQFKEYIVENDRRRGTDFCKTFPEYTEFFNAL